LAGLAATVGLRLLLDPWLGDSLPFVTLFGGVAYAVWVSGYRAAMLVAVLGYALAGFLFIEPRGRIEFRGPGELLGLAAYLFTCGVIIWLGERARRATRQANERRELLRITLRSIGDAVITTDTSARVTYLNDIAVTLTGWTSSEAVGQPLATVFRIVDERSREPLESPAVRALREGIVVGLANHALLVRRDGTESPIDDSAAPIRDESGLVSGCVLIFRDVTGSRRLEHERAEQLHTARLLASIIESSDDAIVSKTLDGIIRSWNAGAERVFGHPAAHAIGKHISLVIPPDRLSEEDLIIARLKAGERIDHFETERVRADGRRIFVSLTISPIRDASGTIVGASKIVRDFTDRKATEAERQKFVTLVEISTDFIGMCDLNGTPFFLNRAGLALVGLDSLEEAARTPVGEFFFPEDREWIVGQFLPSVLEHGHGEVDVRFRHFKTGEARWMAYKVLTIPDSHGRPIAFATVSQEITERRRLTENLRELAGDLSEADRRKNEFLAMLAHELRNPLAPIGNAARALRMGAADAATVRSAAEMVERQVSQLSRLVDDLLDVSRISRGRIELRRALSELGPIVQQAVEAARPTVAAMNHELAVQIPGERIVVDADGVRLAQVIGNLLHNACKFTNPGGHVGLAVSRDGGDAVIRVSDDGIGIAAEDLPIVFDMFAQVDTSLERTRDGLGIGLTLVKTLIDLHGGSVAVSSGGPGLGSEFTVRLPIVDGVGPAERVSAGAPPVSARSRRVLIVDDNTDGAESLALLLRFAGHATEVAHDGGEALAAAERFRPDVTLLDIGLPELNGYEVCQRLRREPWGKSMTIVALTGWGQEEDRRRSSDAGFDGHLVKPVEPAALLRLLQSETSRTERPV
jgi:PAS domain S-box-containing protein